MSRMGLATLTLKPPWDTPGSGDVDGLEAGNLTLALLNLRSANVDLGSTDLDELRREIDVFLFDRDRSRVEVNLRVRC